MKSPIVSDIDFFQQFSLGYDSYRDNNNFVRMNLVETRDRRYLNNFHQNEYTYYDVIQKTPWYGQPTSMPYDLSYDGGSSFIKQNRKLFAGVFFFLSDQVLKHER